MPGERAYIRSGVGPGYTKPAVETIIDEIAALQRQSGQKALWGFPGLWNCPPRVNIFAVIDKGNQP